MNEIIACVVILVGLICWGGQVLSFFSPSTAVRLGLCEPEEEIDPTLYIIETKALGLTDMLLTWTLPLSGFLLLMDIAVWPIFALVGGGIYLYFPAVIMLQRFFLKRHDKKIGSPTAERGAYFFGSIWILSAVAMITMAVLELNL